MITNGCNAGTDQKQRAKVIGFLRGNMDAVAFCELVFFISQVWDDLIDGDKPIDRENVNRAFWAALVSIPWNPFFARHANVLGPIMRAYIADWFAANDLEQGSEHDQTVAFALRDAVGGVLVQCAYLVGGYEWMRRTAPDIRRLVHDENLDDYLRGLK